jgi:H+/Cl- antiporter ClcA
MAASSRSVQTAGLWWFWLAVTIPLTLFVVGLWWLYKEHSSRNNTANKLAAKRSKDAAQPEMRSFSIRQLPMKYFTSRKRESRSAGLDV